MGMLKDPASNKTSFTRWTGLAIILANLLVCIVILSIQAKAVSSVPAGDIVKLTQQLKMPDIPQFWMLLVLALYGFNTLAGKLVDLLKTLVSKAT